MDDGWRIEDGGFNMLWVVGWGVAGERGWAGQVMGAVLEKGNEMLVMELMVTLPSRHAP